MNDWEPHVTHMSADEWNTAVNRALDRLQLTYDELSRMAQDRSFPSLEAKKLWLAIATTAVRTAPRPATTRDTSQASPAPR